MIVSVISSPSPAVATRISARVAFAYRAMLLSASRATERTSSVRSGPSGTPSTSWPARSSTSTIVLTRNSPARLGWLFHHEVGDVLQGEAHRVDRLDHAVVEVAPDPLAFLDDREALDLVVEPGVLHRDRRVAGEELHQLLVDLAEPAVLLRQVQVPDGPAADRHRHAQERVHLGVVGREAVASGILHQVRDPVGPFLADDQAQDAMPSRGRTNPGSFQARHPARD